MIRPVVFINDLPEKIKSLCKMFANDTKIIGKIRSSHCKEDQALIHDDINRFSEWFDNWLMNLNTKIGKRIPIKPV